MALPPNALCSLVAAVALSLTGCARSAASAAATPDPAALPASSFDGGRIYMTNCATCHQADGKGIPGAFPPLAGNSRVTGPARIPIAAVKFGLRGKLSVEGEVYDGAMPAWGQTMSDGDVAAVVSYLRTAWHNGAAEVSADDVRAVAR